MSCYVDDTEPIKDPPPWFPGETGCRLTADSRVELIEMCHNVGLPEPEEGDYQLLTRQKRFIAIRYGAIDRGTRDLFDFGDEAAA